MTKQAIIERTIKALNQLPEDKAEFDFLKNEEDLYTEGDLKEACHVQG